MKSFNYRVTQRTRVSMEVKTGQFRILNGLKKNHHAKPVTRKVPCRLLITEYNFLFPEDPADFRRVKSSCQRSALSLYIVDRLTIQTSLLTTTAQCPEPSIYGYLY